MPIGIKVYGDVNAVRITSSTVQNIAATHPECSTGCTPVARGILISPASGQTIATDVSVEDSSIAHVAPKDDGDCLVIQDSTSPAHLTVKHNTFNYCSKRAIKIQVPGATIEVNTITNPFGPATPNPAYASALPEDMYAAVSDYAPNVMIGNNLIRGSGTFFNPVELGASCTLGIANATVQDNVIDMGYLEPGTSLIRVMVPGADLKIQGNSGSTAQNGITAATNELTNSTIQDNTFTNVTTQFNNYTNC
ncbi:right-handed parallel beta-helix repeat-containing protein [Pseudarthrobacter sp. NPDC080039]|uniref:right-handed parallel beta-helix repeat-containing protein n=1 Tax=unclassified Pseudarthrobacter TaxID=2647000 RepID=UPI00344DD7F8